MEVAQRVTVPLSAYLKTKLGAPTGIQFIDSTKISICHIIRAKRNKTFDSIAIHGKGSMGWFYGFKLHIFINHLGKLLSIKITKGNVNNKKPVEKLTKKLFGHIYADKEYISKKLANLRKETGVLFVTNIRENMKKRKISSFDKLMFNKKFLIETVNDQLKMSVI